MESSRQRAESRYRAVQAARADGHKLTQIAADLGVSAQNLGALVRRRSQHSPFLPELDAWLERRGYLGSAKTEEQLGAALAVMGVQPGPHQMDRSLNTILSDAEHMLVACTASPDYLQRLAEMPANAECIDSIYAFTLRVWQFITKPDNRLDYDDSYMLLYAGANLIKAGLLLESHFPEQAKREHYIRKYGRSWRRWQDIQERADDGKDGNELKPQTTEGGDAAPRDAAGPPK